MFNSFHRHESPITNVHIKQQPNDAADAARLHGEIRAKAITEANDAIIDRLGAFNEFKIVKTASEVRIENATLHVRALFRLNGQQYEVEASESESLKDEVMRNIAVKLVTEIMRQLERR